MLITGMTRDIADPDALCSDRSLATAARNHSTPVALRGVPRLQIRAVKYRLFVTAPRPPSLYSPLARRMADDASRVPPEERV